MYVTAQLNPVVNQPHTKKFQPSMANKPFLAVHTNITDEINTTTTPTVIGRNPVVVTQAQQRRIFDTLTTSIQGNPMAAFGANFQQPQPICYSPYTQGNGFMQAQAQFVPGGVVFRFNTQNSCPPPPCHPCNYYSCSPGLSMDQELALKEFERNGLEALLLQEKFKNNPFVLKFHQNKNTSTGDIMNGPSMGQPDFNAAAAFSANNLFRDYPMYKSEAYSKARQLNLPKNHKDKQSPVSCMEICEDKSTMTNNQTSQVTFFEDQNMEQNNENNNTSEYKENKPEKHNDNKNGGVPCFNDANDLTTTSDSESETDDERNKNKNQDKKTRYN